MTGTEKLTVSVKTRGSAASSQSAQGVVVRSDGTVVTTDGDFSTDGTPLDASIHTSEEPGAPAAALAVDGGRIVAATDAFSLGDDNPYDSGIEYRSEHMRLTVADGMP